MTSADADGEEEEEQQQRRRRTEARRGSRRNFLKAGLALAVVMVAGGIGAIARSLVTPSTTPPTPGGSQQGAGTSSSSSLTFPKVKVGNVADLSAGKSLTFNYPLDDTPNMLVKLGVKAEGGVGPDGDIVAFSQICQHLGCIYGYVETGSSPSCDPTYKAEKPVGYCCCHGSVYDLTDGAKVIEGPSPRPEPQVMLEVDSTGNVYAIGMTPPTVFGHHTGSDDVSYDLQGGTLVS